MPCAIGRVQMADGRLPGLRSRCFWDGKLENLAHVPEGNACFGDRSSPWGTVAPHLASQRTTAGEIRAGGASEAGSVRHQPEFGKIRVLTGLDRG